MGKTESAAALLAHTAVFWPGSTSVVIAPTQRPAAEAVRRCRRMLLKAGSVLATDNAYSIEVQEGGRIIALPGADDSAVRGLSVENEGTALIVEASRVSDELFRAVTPMLARHAETARLIAISTPWIKSGFFYELDRGQDQGWSFIAVRASEVGIVPPTFLAAERRMLGERAYLREYELAYDSTESLFFDRDAIAAAFGEVDMPATPEPVGEPDPVLHRASFLARGPAVTRVGGSVGLRTAASGCAPRFLSSDQTGRPGPSCRVPGLSTRPPCPPR